MAKREEWRLVRGYEYHYAISSLGRLMSIGTGPGRRFGYIFRQRQHKRYAVVMLYRGNKVTARPYLVHRLVLEAFTEPHRELEVNHLDGVKLNNRLSNLEWCTHKHNEAHAARLGLKASGDRNGARIHRDKMTRGDKHWTRQYPDRVLRGEKNGCSKITADDVKEIRRLSDCHEEQRIIARCFGISQTTVWHIIHRHIWRHVE